MPAKKPKEIHLVKVDGTKTHDELMRQLLRCLKDQGIPVQLEPDSPYFEEFGSNSPGTPELTDQQ